MAEQLSNRVSTFLNGTISPTQTSILMQGNVGFPTSPNFRLRIEAELMLVTAMSGLSWTVTRGIENTTPTSHLSGTKATVVLTAGGIQQYIAEQIAASH